MKTKCILHPLNSLNTISSKQTVEVAYVTYFIVLLFLTFTELIKALFKFPAQAHLAGHPQVVHYGQTIQPWYSEMTS
jgi:hypothetical protein